MKSLHYLFFALILSSCTQPKDSDGWTTLFNGKNLDGWHVYGGRDHYNGWYVENGELVFDPLKREDPGTTELLTDQKYTNFELSLEWKVGDYANSGLFWGVVEDEKYTYAYETGPEIQIMDDNWVEYINQRGEEHRAGSLYGMMAPSSVVSKTAGEWNHYLLHIDHVENIGWLQFNGTEVLRFPVHGPEWDSLVSKSGFKDSPVFGKARTGYITLQEFGGKVWFRNIKIMELPKSLDN